ncbi:MAG: hypothetical protein QME96_10955 [Myxococcota bacterium]|nr:hypothetical protein [Myxococcota bacterium]
MRPWNVTLHPSPGALKLLVEDLRGDLMRARLPLGPEHPRALLTVLEGLALWSGTPICAVISVDDPPVPICESALFGGDFWPVESSMVHFEQRPSGRRRRIAGLGDFRPLYAAGRGARP